MEQASITGRVYEREIDYGNDVEFITTLVGLEDVLDEFIGKKVEVYIKVIEE